MLSSLGTAGFPVEYAREVDPHVWRDTYGAASHLVYFWSLPALSSTANGVFGLKLLWSQLSALSADIRRYTRCTSETPHAVLTHWMGDLIYFWLRRHDRLRQAVSYARAEQTNQWTSLEPASTRPSYRRNDIERALARVTWEDESWSTYFARDRLRVIELWYEDLARDPRAVLNLVTGALGLERPDRWNSPLQQQADALNDAWVESFAGHHREGEQHRHPRLHQHQQARGSC